MTMCVKRAGLVWALVLLTATCFILTCAAPTVPKEPAEDEAITTTTNTAEPPTVSTTPPVKSTDEVDSSNSVTTATPAVSDNLSEHVPSDDDADGYLYYQIKKCISGHNLTLGDIQYVLSQKDEEGQFMFALADKLGYMSGGKYDDPRIPVIRSHREKLIELLEKMAAKPPSQQEHSEGPSVSSDETPASKEPASPSDSKKIGLKVSADIRELGPDAIQDILRDLSFSDTLGYAVGIKLGYLPKDEGMKYLENVNADELKNFLQRTLKSKTTSKTTPDEPKQPNEPTPIPPTVKPPNKESGGTLQATKAPSVSDKSEPGPDDGANNTNGAESVPSGPGDSDPIPPTSDSEENENHKEDQVPGVESEHKTSSKEDVINSEDDDDRNQEIPLLSKNLPGEKKTDLFDSTDYDDWIDEAKRTRLLNSEDFQNFLATENNKLYVQFMSNDLEADPNEIDLALDEYLRGLSERSGVMKEGGDDSSNDPNLEAGDGDEPKAKEGETVHRIDVHVCVPHFFNRYHYFGLVHT